MADQENTHQSSSTELATDQAPSTVAADLKSLREDLDTLRSDLGSDMATLTKDVRRLAQDAASLVRETTGAVAGRGRQTIETVQHRVEERPASTLLLSLGAGFVAGSLLGRGSSISRSSSMPPPSAWRGSTEPSSMGQAVTGTRDENYDLISLLYHLTKGAWEYDQYVQDAERNNDYQLAELFREVQGQHQQLAARAKQLLKDRLG
jgi:ElaB/YqjD/DUF883 family membrane-anchored ribosome-binding protein